MFRSLLVTLFIVISGSALVQTNTNSPYSSRGLGDVGFYGSAYFSGLGGVTSALVDSSQTNLFNPSTYSLIAKQLPLFSLGINHYEKTFSNEAGLTSKGRFSSITHMSLAVPFANRLGLAAGLKPFSRVGYEIDDYALVQGDSIFHSYLGNGGVQEFLLGFSGNILDLSNQSLSVGVNGKYYFGKVNNERRTFKTSNEVETGGMDIKSMRARDFGLEFGVNYDYRPNLEHSLRFGGVFRPGKNMRFEKSQQQIYYGNYYSKTSYDTLLTVEGVRGEVYLPSKTSFGLTYKFTPQNDSLSSSSKLRSFMFTVEYSVEDWANYEETFEMGTMTGEYINSNSLRMGFEFIPHRTVLDRSAYIRFFDKISYRVGAFLVNTPYEVNGEQIINQGLTAGLGIPLVVNRAVSRLDISGRYGVMGKEERPGVIKENYFGFNIGINIAPGYDRWFRKYKLD